MREDEAKDEAKLSEFQEELVQMAASLCGDHRKEGFPHKLVENMTASDGVEYVKGAFQKFLDECEKARRNGADGSTICIPPVDSSTSTAVDAPSPKSKSFASKLFSCIVCSGN